MFSFCRGAAWRFSASCWFFGSRGVCGAQPLEKQMLAALASFFERRNVRYNASAKPGQAFYDDTFQLRQVNAKPFSNPAHVGGAVGVYKQFFDVHHFFLLLLLARSGGR